MTYIISSLSDHAGQRVCSPCNLVIIMTSTWSRTRGYSKKVIYCIRQCKNKHCWVTAYSLRLMSVIMAMASTFIQCSKKFKYLERVIYGTVHYYTFNWNHSTRVGYNRDF